mmetsp:Transcript_33668/g.66692  ORF Transcript_33668/g.66692 Transcript_33668/m.66692 type:complete len:82 (-) Transcript_33668:167-412(-)
MVLLRLCSEESELRGRVINSFPLALALERTNRDDRDERTVAKENDCMSGALTRGWRKKKQRERETEIKDGPPTRERGHRQK